MKKLLLLTSALLPLTACIDSPTDPNCEQVPALVVSTRGDTAVTVSGLKYIETQVGTGITAQSCKGAAVRYVGSFPNGTTFDPGGSFSFVPGRGGFIAGFEQGVVGMKVGGRRRVIVPPELGYGARASGPIPANSTLVFDLELLDAEP